MKHRSIYSRDTTTSNAKQLEKEGPLIKRLARKLSRLRNARIQNTLLKYGIACVALLSAVIYLLAYVLELAYSLSIDNISYKSLRGIINKEQARKILNLKGSSINLATLNTNSLKRRLEQEQAIRRATIRAELPDTLCIEVEERIPIVYVEMENGAATGNRTRLFMDPEGVLFPVQEEYHSLFLGVPVWYLHPEDIEELRAGKCIDRALYRPIAEIVTAANAYGPEQIPPIIEIFRPKPWKIILVLESGTEVQMEVRNIKAQMERLYMILDHARATGRKVVSANVIPSVNPVAVFAPAEENKEKGKK